MKRYVSLVVAVCLLLTLSIFPIRAHAAGLNDGQYAMYGFEYEWGSGVTQKYNLSVKKHKLKINGPIYGPSDSNATKKKKRVLKFSSDCTFSYGDCDKIPCSYKKIVKVSKKWMNGKNDQYTGEYNTVRFKIKNGEIVDLYISWEPYEG